MRLREFVDLKENASVRATSSGSVATVSAPIGNMITRNAGSFLLVNTLLTMQRRIRLQSIKNTNGKSNVS